MPKKDQFYAHYEIDLLFFFYSNKYSTIVCFFIMISLLILVFQVWIPLLQILTLQIPDGFPYSVQDPLSYFQTPDTFKDSIHSLVRVNQIDTKVKALKKKQQTFLFILINTDTSILAYALNISFTAILNKIPLKNQLPYSQKFVSFFDR